MTYKKKMAINKETWYKIQQRRKENLHPSSQTMQEWGIENGLFKDLLFPVKNGKKLY